MSTDGSVSAWLLSLRNNGQDAARHLWDRYFRRQVTVAKRELRALAGGGFDEEDVALSAFDAFCHELRAGRHLDVNNRHDLWRLLFLITVRKAHDRTKGARAQKRGGDVVGVSLDELSLQQIEGVLGKDTDPQLSAEMSEECDRLLKKLNHPDLEKLALLKLDGHTNHEIAELMGCARQTVQRRLKLIREIWESA